MIYLIKKDNKIVIDNQFMVKIFIPFLRFAKFFFSIKYHPMDQLLNMFLLFI
jgi:hypothetical protein